MSANVYERITAQIIQRLEEGVVPWRKPWSSTGEGAPKNLVSKKSYRGVNVLLLVGHGYSSNYWVTYRQAANLGGHVRKGERGTPVIFWKWLDVEDDSNADDDAPPRKIPLLRYYTVFNAEQCDGLEVPEEKDVENQLNPIAECEELWEAMPNRPQITHVGSGAFYKPDSDVVNVPRLELFESAEEFYSTLFHEMTHATGHSSRLDRWKGQPEVRPFGSEDYSREELVAEMGAAFLCGLTGVSPAVIDNSASYIQCWIERLQDDHRLVVHAAGAAQKAADYIAGVSPRPETT